MRKTTTVVIQALIKSLRNGKVRMAGQTVVLNSFLSIQEQIKVGRNERVLSYKLL